MDGKQKFVHPLKVYCHQKICQSLETLLKRPGFRDMLVKERPTHGEEVLADIYDGELLKNFADKHGQPFSADTRNLAFMLNIDWFQPHKYRDHSLGVIYLSILNLPREVRYKFENVLVVGILPGPNEPKLNVNTYLQPIVDELLEFWNGKIINEDGNDVLYHGALVCLSSDIPATRKCGGFTSFNALKGTVCTVMANNLRTPFGPLFDSAMLTVLPILFSWRWVIRSVFLVDPFIVTS